MTTAMSVPFYARATLRVTDSCVIATQLEQARRQRHTVHQRICPRKEASNAACKPPRIRRPAFCR